MAPVTALAFNSPLQGFNSPLRVLLVVAHPDDESECAATLYRVTHELGGFVDQVLVTDGAGGQNFSTPALDLYGLPKTCDLRKELPRLRRKEVLRAGRIIGIREHYFLNQYDNGFTLDAEDGIRNWDITRVRRELRRLLERGAYDLVLVLQPTRSTHGHHKTVAFLTREAISELPDDSRPALIGVSTSSVRNPVHEELAQLGGFPEFPSPMAHAVWSFDRHSPLAVNGELDHSIVAHWVIAEHKSQGMFQMEYGRATYEHFWQLTAGGERWESVRHRLIQLSARPQFATNAEAA